MKKATRMLSMVLCLALMCAAFAPIASAAEAAQVPAKKLAQTASDYVGIQPFSSASGFYFSDLNWWGDEADVNYGQGLMARAYRAMYVEGRLCYSDGSPASGIVIYAEVYNYQTEKWSTEWDITDSDGWFYIENTSLPIASGVNMYNAPVSYHYYDVSTLTIWWDDPDDPSFYWWWDTAIYQLAYTIWHG